MGRNFQKTTKGQKVQKNSRGYQYDEGVLKLKFLAFICGTYLYRNKFNKGEDKMTKIVTTVGTSLITNQINSNLKIKQLYDLLKQKDYAQKEDFIKEYAELCLLLKNELKTTEKTSAEIKSLINIKKSKDFSDIEVELIATDTLLSPICAEVLKFLIEKDLNVKVNFDKQNIIKDLQVGDYKRYKSGLINLLNRLNQFAYNGSYFKDMILNITGGFKGVIPYLTIFGQINNVPIYYIFEFTSSLICIPQIPITIDRGIFEKNWKIFYKLNKESIMSKKEFSYDFLQNMQNILEIEDDMVSFNALGKILWDRFEKDSFIFYATDEVYQEIKKQNDILFILSSKFKDIVDSKTETKGEHKVYDDGKNQNRIFYFKDNDNFYIYKTFQNHDIYEKYINQNSINKKDFIKKSKLFKI